MWACLVPPGLEPLSGRIGASYATVGDLILITVLDKATAGDRCEPLGSGGMWTRRLR
jgi:hypothetical protein